MTRSLALLLALALWGVMRGRRHDSDAVSRIGSRRAQTRLSGVVLGMGLASHSSLPWARPRHRRHRDDPSDSIHPVVGTGMTRRIVSTPMSAQG
eukprot:166871-Prorocentrum_minimum.AAC.2